jgi:class I fructose-bisphosphate aldolase
VASTLGVLGACARKYAHKIPFVVKFNHNEFLTYPNKFDQIFFASVKQATNNGGFKALNFGKTSPKIYGELVADHPIDWTRWQVVNCYMGRAGLINSGGASGDNDLHDAVRTAVINKRAGGAGLISGRKAFQRPQKEGVELLRAIQDVYLCDEVTIA